MEYIVKPRENPALPKGYNIPAVPKQYDFYTAETVKDVSDRDVQIPKLEGSYSLQELTARKVLLEKNLADVIEKIGIINGLK